MIYIRRRSDSIHIQFPCHPLRCLYEAETPACSEPPPLCLVCSRTSHDPLLNGTSCLPQTVCPDNKDFSILRFHVGPPYEDIAFKIVSREWEYSYRRGFRCQFHNNIFQLWFHFKRYRYRR